MSKTLYHVSDIHAGPPFSPHLADLIVQDAEHCCPDVIVVSGDMVQREWPDQYQRARAFLDRLQAIAPIIVVPGNHDVPFWNVWLRFMNPMGKYKRYISSNLHQTYISDELVVLGLNTTRSFTIKGGRLGSEQLKVAHDVFSNAPKTACKVVVAHHHFAPPPGSKEKGVVHNARLALRVFDDLGVEVILSGHMHQSYIGNSLDWFNTPRGVIIVNAGTATSRRGKGSERLKNSYNVIHVDSDRVTISHYLYFQRIDRFAPQSQHIYPRRSMGNFYLEDVQAQQSG